VLASSLDFDLIVIGCGPAGEKAGAQAAYFNKRVAIIECAEHVGGSSINTGTVPSKTLRESALYFSGLKQRGLYGIDYSLRENLTVNDFMHHEREVVEMERQRILKNLALHRIELVRGPGFFRRHPHPVCFQREWHTTTARQCYSHLHRKQAPKRCMGRTEFLTWKTITSEPTVGKATPSMRAKWRSSLSACSSALKSA